MPVNYAINEPAEDDNGQQINTTEANIFTERNRYEDDKTNMLDRTAA